MNTHQVSNGSSFLLYTTPNGEVRFDVFVQNETVWLTQKMMAELFDVNVPAISKHLSNIYKEDELQRKATVSIVETVQEENGRKVKRHVEYYNLDAIVAVGYRVNSKRATQFRIWATQVLREYIIKGFAMDDERLKNPNHIFGKDYFEEQLARIRDVRSSERRFYQKITDIYAQCSSDYDPHAAVTKEFFATVQNKLHFAIVGETAAEIIRNRVSSTKKNMGLQTWKNCPKGAIRKTDVGIAKNYLTKRELDDLNRIVTLYLDYAELQARNRVVMTMQDWVEKLNAFLQFNLRDILQDSGAVSHEVALALAEKEFEKYRVLRDHALETDFDKDIRSLEKQLDTSSLKK